MIWSKQKQILKNNLCDSLRERIDFNIIKYRKSHDSLGRAVITLNKDEICSMATIVLDREHFHVVGFRLDNESFEDYIKRDSEGYKIVNENGYFSEFDFYEAINIYLNISIEDAMKSENILVRALAMLDKRLGKRRLKNIYENIEKENDLVKKFYNIRIESDNMILKKNVE
ncbi:SF0329 family protein [Faecalimicrobium sp. JNUCC 81]